MLIPDFLPVLHVFPYLFPARGRKPLMPLPNASANNDVFPYLFPARGRKLAWEKRQQAVFGVYVVSYSLKGFTP